MPSLSIAESLLGELSHELVSTRKMLERLPNDKFSWKPHSKSMTLGALVSHICEIPTWGIATVEQDSFDVAPQGQAPYKTPQVNSSAEALTAFDKNYADFKKSLEHCTDEAMMNRTPPFRAKGSFLLNPSQFRRHL